jgi:DNA polymerase (family X)
LNPVPFLLRRLHELGVVDGQRIESLTREGIVTVADLELAIAEGRPAASDPLLRHAAAALAEERAGTHLGYAWDIFDALSAELRERVPELDAFEVSGDTRRYVPLPRHLAAIGRAADAAFAATTIAQQAVFTNVLHRAERRMIALYHGLEIDIRIATRDEFGSLLFTTTGPAAHVAAVLRRRGPRLASTENEVYTQAGLGYLPPEVRDSPGVLDAARLPALVTREDIRGDLHMHTTYSDGRDSLREMVAACCTLGYEYIAITDHSEHAAAPHTLNAESLKQQHDEIDRLRDQFPQIAILHGIEADILEDGRVDCPDSTLESLDIVLASLHERGHHDDRQLTERCLRAIRHPLVNVITHPQNQIVGRRAGYEMDFDAIYEAAAETGTALEIDGAPAHLDLDGAHAREAVSNGVTVVIDSDCHRASWLPRQMQLGIGTARRGWVPARRVLNTRSLGEIRAFIARKRSSP